jgi:hypothetical protein
VISNHSPSPARTDLTPPEFAVIREFEPLLHEPVWRAASR